MDLRDLSRDVLKVPYHTYDFMRTAFMPRSGDVFVEQLQRDEPRMRAVSALDSAKRALYRRSPDYELAAFEAWRASGAALFIADRDEDLLITRSDVDIVRSVRRGVVSLNHEIADPPQTLRDIAEQYQPIGGAAVELALRAQRLALSRPQEATPIESFRQTGR